MTAKSIRGAIAGLLCTALVAAISIHNEHYFGAEWLLRQGVAVQVSRCDRDVRVRRERSVPSRDRIRKSEIHLDPNVGVGELRGRGDLRDPSDTSVSATAGARGAGNKGLKLKDGGDYAAVEKLENRDASWKKTLDTALADFQKSGKVGKAREDQ